MIRLLPEPLTASRFSPFGEVIEVSDAATHYPINGGTTMRYHDLARLSFDRDGRAIVSIFRAAPRVLPMEVRLFERHPKGSQAFVPLSGKPWLALVAPPSETLDPSALRLFLCRGDQGCNYAPSVWHHALLALEAQSDFLVIDRAGPGENCDEVLLDASLTIALS